VQCSGRTDQAVKSVQKLTAINSSFYNRGVLTCSATLLKFLHLKGLRKRVEPVMELFAKALSVIKGDHGTIGSNW
jgi:hypothetical protein